MKLPKEFEERMSKMLGNEYCNFIKALDCAPIYTGIRINTARDGAGKAVRKVLKNAEMIPWCENGFYADKSDINGNHPYHLAGLFYFQEPSAMSGVEALPINEGDRVLDLCAAPGGKSTQAGVKLKGSGILVANEIIKSRAGILSDNIQRFGLTNAIVTNETPQRLAEKYPRFFDKIIVDAPCSGEGMFRKEPQAVDEWSEAHTLSCASRQKHILDCAMRMLRGGGYLVYSTCTFAPAENEQICAYLLDNYNAELTAAPKLHMLSPGRSDLSGSAHDISAARRVFPHLHKGEGHFTALFRSLDSPSPCTDAREKKSPVSDAEKMYREFEKEFLKVHLDGEFCLFGENLYLKPRGIDIDKIKVVRAGLHLGIYRKNRFEPSHALCLALSRDSFKNTIDLSSDSSELKKYLMGDTLACDKKGWCAVTADSFPIGWGKVSNDILKNHFPKYMRLKK